MHISEAAGHSKSPKAGAGEEAAGKGPSSPVESEDTVLPQEDSWGFHLSLPNTQIRVKSSQEGMTREQDDPILFWCILEEQF